MFKGDVVAGCHSLVVISNLKHLTLNMKPTSLNIFIKVEFHSYSTHVYLPVDDLE